MIKRDGVHYWMEFFYSVIIGGVISAVLFHDTYSTPVAVALRAACILPVWGLLRLGDKRFVKKIEAQERAQKEGIRDLTHVPVSSNIQKH